MGMGWKKTVTTAKHLLNIYFVPKLRVLVWGKELGGQSQDF